MEIYKPSMYITLKNAFYGLFIGVGAAWVAYYFLDFTTCIFVGIGVGLLCAYWIGFTGKVSIHVEGDRVLVLKGRTVTHSFSRGEVLLRMRVSTKNGDSNCSLTFATPGASETVIDCSCFGRSRFMKLCDRLEINQPEEIEAKTLPTKKK